jgi:hypothetical protein
VFARYAITQAFCSERCSRKAKWAREKHKPYAKNREAVNVNYRKRLRQRAIAVMGRCCARCGFDDARALQFDHRVPLRRNSNGMSTKAHTADKTYRAVLDGDHATYELLCANCHAIKTRADQDGDAKAAVREDKQMRLFN